MPRWLPALLAVSLFVLAVSTAQPILFPTQNPHITESNLHRITLGMRQKDVEAILGGPPGDYRTRPTIWPGREVLLKISGHGWGTRLTWEGDNAIINVYLNTKGEIDSMIFAEMAPESVGVLTLLHWRWDRWHPLKTERENGRWPPPDMVGKMRTKWME